MLVTRVKHIVVFEWDNLPAQFAVDHGVACNSQVRHFCTTSFNRLPFSQTGFINAEHLPGKFSVQCAATERIQIALSLSEGVL